MFMRSTFMMMISSTICCLTGCQETPNSTRTMINNSSNSAQSQVINDSRSAKLDQTKVRVEARWIPPIQQWKPQWIVTTNGVRVLLPFGELDAGETHYWRGLDVQGVAMGGGQLETYVNGELIQTIGRCHGEKGFVSDVSINRKGEYRSYWFWSGVPQYEKGTPEESRFLQQQTNSTAPNLHNNSTNETSPTTVDPEYIRLTEQRIEKCLEDAKELDRLAAEAMQQKIYTAAAGYRVQAAEFRRYANELKEEIAKARSGR